MQYYPVKEVAAMLHMHPYEVRKAIVEQRLGALRNGDRDSYLLPEKHIESFLVPAGADWSPKRK